MGILGIVPVLIYIGLCLLVGFRGMDTRIGYWGVALLSFVLTPLVVFFAMVLLDRTPRQRG
ncbi:MAG: hypothetical protein ROR55_22185 [Devosia sp.]